MSFNGEQVFLQSVSAVTATRGAADPELGYVRVEGNKWYRYVYNAGNSQVSPGYAMQTITDGASTAYSGTISTTVNVPLLGIVHNATLTTGTYGWVVFKGYTKFVASSTVAAADLLQVGANGKLHTAATYPGVGFANSAAVTGASAGIAINLP